MSLTVSAQYVRAFHLIPVYFAFAVDRRATAREILVERLIKGMAQTGPFLKSCLNQPDHAHLQGNEAAWALSI